MEIRGVRVKLYVHDFENRQNFYLNTLGWQVISSWNNTPKGRGVMFQMGTAVLELLESSNAQLPELQNHVSCDLSLEVPDVWRLWAQLKERTNIIFPLRENSWGDSSFCISDSGGFQLTFFSANR